MNSNITNTESKLLLNKIEMAYAEINKSTDKENKLKEIYMVVEPSFKTLTKLYKDTNEYEKAVEVIQNISKKDEELNKTCQRILTKEETEIKINNMMNEIDNMIAEIEQ